MPLKKGQARGLPYVFQRAVRAAFTPTRSVSEGDFTWETPTESLTSLLTLRVGVVRVSVVRDSRSRARADAIGVSAMTAVSVRLCDSR